MNPHTTSTRSRESIIQEARDVFSFVWQKLEAELGRENLRFPGEVIFLGGAPASGKGTHTRFVLKTRGLASQPIIVSSLLDTPEARRIKDAGGMVGDREVTGLLFRKLLEPQYAAGVVIDGFPRTQAQVECARLLFRQMQSLHREFQDCQRAGCFRQPSFRVMVFHIDEKTSVERQLQRGHEIRAHNEEVERTGAGVLLEERDSDNDPAIAQTRYHVFEEQTWDALQSLREDFPYHLIDTSGSIENTDLNILRELAAHAGSGG